MQISFCALSLVMDLVNVCLFSVGIAALADRKRGLKSNLVHTLWVCAFLSMVAVLGIFGSLEREASRTPLPDASTLLANGVMQADLRSQITSLRQSKELLPANFFEKRDSLDRRIADALAQLKTLVDDAKVDSTRPPAAAALFVDLGDITGLGTRAAHSIVDFAFALFLEVSSLVLTALTIIGPRLTKQRSNKGPAFPEPGNSNHKRHSEARSQTDNHRHIPIGRDYLMMATYMAVAFRPIEANRSTAFPGRGHLERATGFSRSDLDFCSQVLRDLDLTVVSQSPRRTVPTCARKAMIVRVAAHFSTPAESRVGKNGNR